jgi:hypothetical protein
MAANGAKSQLRSEVRIPLRDGVTSSSSPVDTPREDPTQVLPIPQRPLLGPFHPTETPEDAASTGVLISNLIRTVHRQTSLIEEQNHRLMELEQARPTVQTRRSLSPIRNRGGGSPSRSRSRSPRHSASIGSPSYSRRSTRRSPRRSPPRRSPPRRAPSQRSPVRRTPPRRSPPRRNRFSRSPFSSLDTRDTRADRTAYGPFTRVSGKLLSLADWKSRRRWTLTMGLPIRTSTLRTSKQFSLTDRCGAPLNASSSSLP